MQIQQALKTALNIDQLDAEILLAHVLNFPRSYLHTYPEKLLSEPEQKKFFELVKRREKGEPIAYLVGVQEFWSLPFEVNTHTLVPRPETELLVEVGLQLLHATQQLQQLDYVVADLGTGSGAVAIALAHEQPQWRVLATDKDANTLVVAQRNAERLHIPNIKFYLGDWCQALPKDTQCDAIFSNPPYIAEHDPHLQQSGVCCEPMTALVSGHDGLDDIRKIISHAGFYLKSKGFLLLEHGYDQGSRVRDILQKFNYSNIKTYEDLSGNDRVTVGQHIE